MVARDEALSGLLRRLLEEGFEVDPEVVVMLCKVAESNIEVRVGTVGEPYSGRKLVERIVDRLIGVKSTSKGPAIEGSFSKSRSRISVKDLFEEFPELYDELENPKIQKSGDITDGSGEWSSIEGGQEIGSFEVVMDSSEEVQSSLGDGFSALFKDRYEKLGRILSARTRDSRLVKVSEVSSLGAGEKVGVVGLVLSKKSEGRQARVVLEDDTGQLVVVGFGEEFCRNVEDVLLDSCVSVEGEVSTEGTVVAKKLMYPDVPTKVVSTSKKTEFAVFSSDLHVGSRRFLEGAFDRFVSWLNGRFQGKMSGDISYEEIARRVKYLVVGGDVVDGVGVFPGQEEELVEMDVKKQYDMVLEKFAKIPRSVQVIVAPGNHDCTRQALPQPKIPVEYASRFYELENICMVGDPCFLRLSGVRVLVFHGRSLDDVFASVSGTSYERPTEAMKVLLRARHLAPSFGLRTPVAPMRKDLLVIGEVPDIFHAGHVHTVGCDMYRGTLLINSGTWQGQTVYQANLGIIPTPGVVPVVNLSTLEVCVLDFVTSG
jgi:DNA polymerase II small subunit